MKYLIFKNRDAYLNVSKHKIWHAHFAGYWQNDGSFSITKDRMGRLVGSAISDDELSTILNKE